MSAFDKRGRPGRGWVFFHCWMALYLTATGIVFWSYHRISALLFFGAVVSLWNMRPLSQKG